MIALRRYRVKPPSYLRNVAINSTRELRIQWRDLKTQDRMRFDEKLLQEFRHLLQDLGNGKCAYCEILLPTEATGGTDHFRPIRSVAEHPEHPGYYWLAYDWDNLLPACGMCLSNKRDWFPLRNEAKRVSDPKGRLASERPLLLDPSAPRFIPDHHLKYAAKTGLVAPSSVQGEATIQILGLNREELVRARRQTAVAVDAALIKAYKRRGPVTDSSLDVRRLMMEFTRSKAPYAGIARQMVEEFIEARVKTPHRLRMEQEVKAILLSQPSDLERAITENEEAPAIKTAARRGYVARIEVRNFKCIRKLGLEFSPAASGGQRAGWQMLLGENGTGKSSLLQALALGLGGRGNLKEPWLQEQDFVSDGSASRGSVRIWLSTDAAPIRLNFTRKRLRYARGQDGVGMFLRAYGAIRLPPQSENASGAAENPDERRVIRNLFQPFAPLCDANRWLADLDEPNFNRAARTLKDVLSLGSTENITLARTKGVVFAKTPQRSLGSLRTLSRGQQAVLDLAADIMSGMMKESQQSGDANIPNDFQRAEGIVLLDEIDAHLHPRWKMEIVPSLRRAFPNLQFLATTHEPLCLRGLEGKEIVIMRNPNEDQGLEAEVTKISPVGWRVDQLLTSPLFGLSSTIDPIVEAEFQEFYALLARPSTGLTQPEQARLVELRGKAKAYNRLGFTRRDQLLYEVIDDCLAKEIHAPLSKQPAIHEKTRKKVADLWREITIGELR